MMTVPYKNADAFMALIDAVNPATLTARQCRALLEMVGWLRADRNRVAQEVTGLPAFEQAIRTRLDRLAWRRIGHVPGQLGFDGNEVVLDPV